MMFGEIIIVYGNPTTRFGLSMLMKNLACATVIEETGNGEEAVSVAASLRPDLVILGLNLDGELTGFEVCARLKSLRNPPRTLILSDRRYGSETAACLLPEADSCLHVGSTCQEILDAVHRTLDGERVWRPSKPTTGVSCFDPRTFDVRLSGQERKVAALIFRRRTNEEIARDLHLSITTVKTHVRSILRKSRVKSRFELI